MTATKLPLANKLVLVTRPSHQSNDLSQSLIKLGAEVVEMPAIEIQPPDSFKPFDAALRCLGQFDWVVLTSVNGVASLADRLRFLDIPPSKLAGRKLAAIGPATAEALANLCLRPPDVVPSEYVAEALGRELPAREGDRVLLARADIARKELAVMLRARGVLVEEVSAYRIVPAPDDAGALIRKPDFVTITSSASARSTHSLFSSSGHESWLREAKIVCIGPITAATVEELGLEVAITATEYTIPGLLKSLVDLVEARA